MTNATPTGEASEATRSAFGETLEALMRSRCIATGPEDIRSLAQRSGLDPDALLAAVLDDGAVEDLGPDLRGLGSALSLSRDEQTILAVAYTYREPGAEKIRRLGTSEPGGKR